MALLKFTLSDQSNTTVLIDVSEIKSQGGLVKASRADNQAKDAVQPLDHVLQKSLPAITGLANYLASIEGAGLHAKLELGLRLTDECDLILTGPATEQATFKLSLQLAK